MKKAVLILILVMSVSVGWSQPKPSVPLGDPAYKALADSLTNLGDKEFYEDGNLINSFRHYEKAYRKYGGLDAAFMIGDFCANGYAYDGKLETAYKIWEKAAHAGHMQSARTLGECMVYYTKTQEKGLYWMELADSLGSPDAAYTLAQLYRNGLCIEKNDSLSWKWYQKAADKGVGEAQQYVGIIYFEGKTVKRNILKAVKYLNAAAEQGLPIAAYYSGLCCENGWGMPTPDYISAAYYYMIAADGEIPEAQYRLSQFYTEGKGVDENPKRAAYWLEQAKKNGAEIEK